MNGTSGQRSTRYFASARALPQAGVTLKPAESTTRTNGWREGGTGAAAGKGRAARPGRDREVPQARLGEVEERHIGDLVHAGWLDRDRLHRRAMGPAGERQDLDRDDGVDVRQPAVRARGGQDHGAG